LDGFYRNFIFTFSEIVSNFVKNLRCIHYSFVWCRKYLWIHLFL